MNAFIKDVYINLRNLENLDKHTGLERTYNFNNNPIKLIDNKYHKFKVELKYYLMKKEIYLKYVKK
jgi:hypothetical protein